MMSNQVSKSPLDLNLYKKYSIPQEFEASVLEITAITQNQCDDFEFEYTNQGYKIFSAELVRAKADLFNLTLVVGKSPSHVF